MRGKHQWLRYLTELVLIVLFGLLIAISLSDHTKGTSPTEMEEEEVQTYTANWTDASNIEHEVKTTREDGESQTAWANRHKAAVDALKALYPPA